MVSSSALRIAAVDPSTRPISYSSPSSSSSSPSPSPIKIVLDEKARQAALRKTWELEDAKVVKVQGKGTEGKKEFDPERWEKLKEAMKDLKADDLTKALHESYQD